MITKETKEAISRLVPESHILYDEPLKKHTTFQVGGNSDCLIFVEKEKELKSIIDTENLKEKETQDNYIEMLEDMIMVAINNTFSKIDEFKERKMSKFGNIPGLF